jgi:D-alanine-D-alanine ligase-like ATP-grasp enzyme
MATNGHRSGGALRVAVLAGGRSSEHDVSLSSGEAVREGCSQPATTSWVEIARDGTGLAMARR